MPDFEDLSESLKVEVLTEMADTYFGARRELDQLLERFDQLTDRLAKVAIQVMTQAGLLHELLLEDTGAPGFYRAVGVDPEAVPRSMGRETPAAPARLPLALTPRGRWLKAVKNAYTDYQILAHDYMHGHKEVDARDPRRKRTSLHYAQLADLAERINAKIHYVNEDLSMREALEYAKRLDPVVMERERMAGGGQYHEEERSSDKDFVPIDFEHLGLRPMPELPEPKTAWKMAGSWLKAFYGEHGPEIRALMVRLASREQPVNPED